MSYVCIQHPTKPQEVMAVYGGPDTCTERPQDPHEELLIALAAEVQRLQSALRLACTPPWPTWTDAMVENVETLVNFWMRRAAAGEAQP